MHNIGEVKNVEDFRTVFAKNEEQTNLLTSYTEYKQRLDFELQKQTESFVRVGYLLKVARDTNVLAESGYKTVAEFAQAEYGLSKDVVSRYIAINDRYSEGGYSDRLQDKYEGYGYSKLTEMLTLPEEIVTEIKPTLTRKEIQEIKKEVAEEEKISPMEVALEAAEVPEEERELSQTQKVWREFFRNNKDVFLKLKAAIENMSAESFTDIMAPSGNAVLFTRVPGAGKIMITVDGEKDPVVMTNVRDLAKEEQTVKEALEDLNMLFGQTITKKAWERVYGEAFDEEKAKNEDKPQKTTENVIKPQETVIKQEENVIKEEENDEECSESIENTETDEKQEAESEEREEEQAAEPVTDFMPEPEPGTIGHLKVVKEVAPVQQDTNRIIEVTREVNKEEFEIAEETDHSECKEKLKQGLKNFKSYIGFTGEKITRAANMHWDEKRLYEELEEILEEALDKTQEAKAALEYFKKLEKETGGEE